MRIQHKKRKKFMNIYARITEKLNKLKVPVNI